MTTLKRFSEWAYDQQQALTKPVTVSNEHGTFYLSWHRTNQESKTRLWLIAELDFYVLKDGTFGDSATYNYRLGSAADLVKLAGYDDDIIAVPLPEPLIDGEFATHALQRGEASFKRLQKHVRQCLEDWKKDGN